MAFIQLHPAPSHCSSFVSSGTAGEAPAGQKWLRLGLLNLMPNKEETEIQWLRLLQQTDTPFLLSMQLLKFANWQPKSTSALYMAQYYRAVEDELANGQLDALIITGAPLGQLAYQDVRFWADFKTLLNQLSRFKVPCFFSCWAANAGLFGLYKVATMRRDKKLSGLFLQDQIAHQWLTEGITEPCWIPQSRYAQPHPEALSLALESSSLQVSMSGPESGPTLLYSETDKHVFQLGHVEYEADTLAREYTRDCKRDPATPIPQNYFLSANEQGGQKSLPTPSWQTTGVKVLQNWLQQL